MASSSNSVPFPSAEASPWIEEYQQACLTAHDPGTIRVYRHILQQFIQWVGKRAGKANLFSPEQITMPIVEQYLKELASQQYSPSHCKRVRSVIAQFCQWLIEEKALLRRNPTRGVVIASPTSSTPSVPCMLTPIQRLVFLNLVKQEDRRGAALFALGYWAGCRVSDVSWLAMAHTHVGPKIGWVRVGHKGGKWREIDLVNEARKPLYEYLQATSDPGREYVFSSQRSARLTEEGIHHWFRTLKTRATKDQWEQIKGLTFHDLLHDFAHRARAAGWSLEEVAYYLGHVTKKGTPAIQTTVRYTQVSREQVKDKLKRLRG